VALDPIVITFDMLTTPQGDVAQFSAYPELDEVPWGTSPTIVWALKTGPNASDAQFHPAVGIRFVTSARYPAQWPYGQPAPVPGTAGAKYSVVDPNTAEDAETTVYKYNVTVVLDGQTYTWDPEEENEGKTG
jgi:hypothetical protein